MDAIIEFVNEYVLFGISITNALLVINLTKTIHTFSRKCNELRYMYVRIRIINYDSLEAPR